MAKGKLRTSKQHGGAQQSIDTQATLGAGSEMIAERGPDGPKRPPRRRLHSGQNLYVPEHLLDRKNFAYRWFAENSIKGGRVALAEGAWWSYATDEVGNNFKRPSGLDQMFLMKLEIQYWKEDQELKRAKVRATLHQETSIGDGEYAPSVDGRAEGGVSAVTRSLD